MGDQHVRAVVVGQGGDRFRILGQTRLRTGIVPRTRQVDGPPRDSSLVQLNSDVAPAPRATPRAVHENVRRRTHVVIFPDGRSDCQTVECRDGAAF